MHIGYMSSLNVEYGLDNDFQVVELDYKRSLYCKSEVADRVL